MSTYTKTAGGTGSAVGIVVVVSRHDCFVLFCFVLKIKVEGYIGDLVVRWRIQSFGMARHGKSSLYSNLNVSPRSLTIKISSSPKPSFEHLTKAHVTSNLKFATMASLPSQMVQARFDLQSRWLGLGG